MTAGREWNGGPCEIEIPRRPMKTKIVMMAALLVAACDKVETVEKPARSAEAQAKESLDTGELHRLAGDAVRKVQFACLLDGIRSDARETLKRQVGAGAAQVAKMDFDSKDEQAKKANEASQAALDALIAEEDRLSKAGLKWEGAIYSNVIQSYETEARNLRRSYELAEIRRNVGTLHSDWLAFLKVTIEQIRDGDY